VHWNHSVRWLLPVKLWRMPCISNPVVFVVWCLWMLALLVVWFGACTPALHSMSSSCVWFRSLSLWSSAFSVSSHLPALLLSS